MNKGTAWVHGKVLGTALSVTTTYELMHVTDWLPTLVAAVSAEVSDSERVWDKPLDGISHCPFLTRGGNRGA